MNNTGLFYPSSQLQPATILVFSEPIESVYSTFPKLKFVATVSPFWNANVTPRSSLSLTIGYHQNQQYGFQNYSNLRNTQPQFFSQQLSQPQYFPQRSSQPQYFPQPSSQPQFKVPQAKDPHDGRRRQKKTGNNPLSIWTRTMMMMKWHQGDRLPVNNNEEILLAEAWIEHSQDANIGKNQHEDIYWNLIMSDFNSRTTAPPRTKNMMMGKWTRMHGDYQRFNSIYKHLNRKSGERYADLVENAKTIYIERYGKKFLYPHVWSILKNYLKWNAAELIDEDNLQELFGPDPRERPASKQRAKKKQKSVETTSAGGSTGGSTGGSQSESVSSLVSQDYRRKCDAAEKAYEANREKELAIMQCKELEFLMIDPSSLPPAKRAIIERKQAEIMRKYPDA
ncbi:hypothetical protein Tco_1470392 [Tanacetum coccineum]